MPGKLIQRWTIGEGGFIGEVSLFELSDEDQYVRHTSARKYVELSNLHIHPLRRGLGWSDSLLIAAISYARARNWTIFLRAIPYNKPHMSADRLVAYYKCYGFRSRARDPREMVLKCK